MKQELNYYNFDIKEFSERMNGSDECGLQYLERNLICYFKKEFDLIQYNKQEYITVLFYATLELNNLNNMYESSLTDGFKIPNKINELYLESKGLLLSELGIEYDNGEYHF